METKTRVATTSTTEFPDLVNKYGRETVAKSVAVVLLTDRHFSVDEVVSYTGLSREYVERLKSIYTALAKR